MVHLKTASEIRSMIEGGRILKQVATQLISKIQPGITTEEIDFEAERLIRLNNAEPSFKKVKGYKWTTCIPINYQAVHTPPSKRKILNGDIVTLDIGVFYKGLHTDYATTVAVGQVSSEIATFLKKGETVLNQAIGLIEKDKFLGEIGDFIYREITGSGYSVMKELTGHGIGKELHEDPYVFNYLNKPVNKTFKIKQGLTIAVEIIYSLGGPEIDYEKGVEWSIISKDKSICACFERSIAVSENNIFILT